MDSYQECEVCGGVADDFFCDEHAELVTIVEDAFTTPNVANPARHAAVQAVRYLREVPK